MELIKNKFDFNRYTTPKEMVPDHEYEHYVTLTSKLIDRSYIVTAKLIEQWPLEVIKRRYHDAERNRNPAMRWWELRKFNL